MKLFSRIDLWFTTCCLGLFFVQSAIAQESWTQFQNGGTLSSGQWDLATRWSPDQGIEWELGLAGYGQSSPIIVDDSIYITSISGPNKETTHVFSVDLKKGTQNWEFKSKNSSPFKNTPMVSRAAPSPVADSNGVIAFFEGGNIVALDPEGKLRWDRDLAGEFGEINARHGLAASLEQDSDNIFVWIERDKEPYVMAIKKSDGTTSWKSVGLGTTTWGSPRLIPVAGGSHLVLSGVGALAGLDPATGKRLWDFKEIAGNSSSTPVPVGEGRFLIGSSGGSTEGETVLSNGVIQISKTESGYDASWVWQAKKATVSFGSPFVLGDRAYFVNRSGILHCLDLETGKPVYVARTPSSIWATPLATRDFIYIFGKEGVTTVVKPGEKFEVIAENRLWNSKPKSDDTEGGPSSEMGGGVLYAAAVADSKLILRRGDRLFAIGKSADQ